MGDLLEFYGEECVPCRRMAVLVRRLEIETGVRIERFEVWHNAANERVMMQYAAGKCASVPFFYNKRTGDYVCGEADYERLRKWAGVQ